MGEPAQAAAPPPAIVGWPRRYIQGVIALGAVVLAASAAALGVEAAAGALASWPVWALLAGLIAGSWIILRRLLLFDWRGQRVALAPDEVLVLVALLSLPPALVVLFALPSMAVFQVSTRRGFLRGGFNVAVLLVSAGAAVAADAALLALRAPALVAALGGIAAYTATNLLLVANFFALRERADVFLVYKERFLVPTAFHFGLALCVGVPLVALWALHPLAVLSLAPLAWFAAQHMQLLARTDRESLVHKRLAEMDHELVGAPDVDAVAARVIDTCGDIFHAGHVTMTVAADDGRPPRSWSRDYPGGFDPRIPPLAEVVPDPRGGPLGAITVHPTRDAGERYGPAERALLRIVAGDAAASIQNARALRQLDDSRRALLSQRLARPLVRRIVRALVEETRADYHVLMRLGEGLAREADATDLDALCGAYAEMGLGSLRHEPARGGQHVFVGHDLFERAPRSSSTTCYIALGFLVGAVSRAHGSPARGTEVACQSRGDAECRFVVQARREEAGAARRGDAGPPPGDG